MPGGRKSRGLTLVELLIGTALSLFIVSAGLALLTSHLHDHRSLVLEARLMQDLRAASDAMARDLRRAGHWGGATAAIWRADTPVRANPYQALTQTGGRSDMLGLSYSRDATENHGLDDNETFGIRLRNQGIDILLGNGNWQALTDPATVIVTGLQLAPEVHEVRAPCDLPCPPDTPGASPCPPRLQVRHVTLTLTGISPFDARVQRTLRTSVRVRNDALEGRCP
jgi:prepilin peptidase dependent protein B